MLSLCFESGFYADIRRYCKYVLAGERKGGETLCPLHIVRAYKVGSFRVSNNLAWKRDLYETVNLITQFREGARPADGAGRTI